MLKRTFKNTGVTLVELLVVMTILAVIGGILYEVFSVSSKSSAKQISKEQNWLELRLINKKIDIILNNIIHETANAVEKPSFKADSITVPAITSNKDKKAVAFCNFINDVDKDGINRILLVKKQPDGKAFGDGILISVNNKLNASISFRYAAQYNGLEPVWQDSLPAGTYPKIIEYKITLIDDTLEKSENEISFTGAVVY